MFKSHFHVSHFKPSISRDGIESITVDIYASNGKCSRFCCMFVSPTFNTSILVTWNFYANALTRILPLHVMIVKLRQNFPKMREFSRIREQKN